MSNVMNNVPLVALLLVGFVLSLFPVPQSCNAAQEASHLVYVPVYTFVYTGDRAVPVNLASTLSIRNTDPANPVRIERVEYYASNGNRIKNMIEKPLMLAPLASTNVYIKEKDTSGGFSTSFLVRWSAMRGVSSPVIECINIGAYSGLGISFVTVGKEIR